MVSSLIILGVGILPALISAPSAYAAGEVTSRQVVMSQSAPGATGVTYTIKWKTATTASLNNIYVQFCADSPITTSTTCVYPAGFSLSVTTTPTYTGDLTSCTATPSAVQVGTSGTAVNNTLDLSYSTACATTAGTAESISLPGDVTNPTTACTGATTCEFWARILTYSSPTTYTTGDQTNVVDEGGVALSTASTISISATVEEQLQFCVYASPGSCGGSTALTIGTGSPAVLSFSQAYYAEEEFDLTTNASNGVTISVLGPNVLTDATSNTIPANTTASALPLNSLNGGFGLYLITPTGNCSGITVSSPYAAGSVATPPANVEFGATSSSISQIASTTGPVGSCTGQGVNYGAVAGTTTPQGVYTATPTGDQFIATGSF